jgi:hypothetical protein
LSPRNEKATVPSMPAVAILGPAMSILRRLVAPVVGSEARAEDLLYDAGAATVTNSASSVAAFAHEVLAPRLAESLGDRAAAALLARLDAELLRATELDFEMDVGGASSNVFCVAPAVPPSQKSHISRTRGRLEARPRVTLLDEDRFRRATLAQRLASSACDVAVATSIAELSTMFEGSSALHAVVIDEAHPWLPSVVSAVASAKPRVALVVLVESATEAMGRDYYQHVKDEPVTELLALLRALAT